MVGRGANGAGWPGAPVGGAEVDGRANGAGIAPGCVGRGGARGDAAIGVVGLGGTGDAGRDMGGVGCVVGRDGGGGGGAGAAAGGGTGVGRAGAGAGIENAGVARAAGVARGGVIGDGIAGAGGGGVGRGGGGCTGVDAGVGMRGTDPETRPDGPDVRAAEAAVACIGGAPELDVAKSLRSSAPAETVMTPPHTEQRARMAVPGSFAGLTRNTERHSGQVTFIRGLRRARRSSVR
jgi:hypothetical protein